MTEINVYSQYFLPLQLTIISTPVCSS